MRKKARTACGTSSARGLPTTGESLANAGGTISTEPGWNGMSVCMWMPVSCQTQVYGSMYMPFNANVKHICEYVLITFTVGEKTMKMTPWCFSQFHF